MNDKNTNPKTDNPLEGFMSKRACATLLMIDPNTLDNWRRKGKGPPEIHKGRLILFNRTDVLAWLRDGGTEQRGPDNFIA